MTLREGRLRVVGPTGRCIIRYRLTESTISIRALSEPEGCKVALQIRGRSPAVFRTGVRLGRRGEVSSEGFWGRWDLRPGGSGLDSVAFSFEYMVEQIGAGADAPPSARRTHARIRIMQLLRALGREAVARCAQRAREIALNFRDPIRFWVYARIVDDPSGRVAQMATVCPGLLIACHALERGGRMERDPSERMAAIRWGVPLPRLLRNVTEETLEAGVEYQWLLEADSRRLRMARPVEHAAAAAARRQLLRRAGPLVEYVDLLQLPFLCFVPDDIPTDPIANARWFRSMRVAHYVISRVWEVDLREGLSSFVAAHEPLLAARSRRPEYAPLDAADVDNPGLHGLMQRLVHFARETGRRPSRRSNPRRVLDECRVWLEARERDLPDNRLAEFLRRVPALGLGEVTAVKAIAGSRGWGRLDRIRLPRAPLASASVPGVEIQSIDTPEALAAEGLEMSHCVATWLPRVMAGATWIYSASVSGVRVTVALERQGRRRKLVLAEARRAHDELPTASQLRHLQAWVDRLNEREVGEGVQERIDFDSECEADAR